MYCALSGMLSADGEGKVLIGQQLGYGMLQIFRISGMGQLQWRLNLRVFLWLMKKAIYYILRCLSHKPPFLIPNFAMPLNFSASVAIIGLVRMYPW
jgi:hypothetical protein